MPRHLHHFLIAGLVAMPTLAAAEVRMPAVFSDHMVLQRDAPVPIWGWADPGEGVQVTFGTQSSTTVAGPDGDWRVDLQPLTASSTPRRLSIEGTNVIEIEDVLVGEVWICGGQSNMEWPVDASSDPKSTRANANRPNIRLINAPRRTANTPENDTDAGWRICSPRTVGAMTAVGYAFACDLQDELDVPVGLLSINWGGTRIEPWISTDSLMENDLSREIMQRQVEAVARFDSMTDGERFDLEEDATRRHRRSVAEYLDRQLAADPGIAQRHHDPTMDDSDWSQVGLPSLWDASRQWAEMDEGLQDFDGSVWFRRTIDVPEDWANRPLLLELGSIDDSDIVWFDGIRIGSTVERHQMPRRYRVPGVLVKAGPRTITVMAIDSGGAGGFNGPGRAMKIGPMDRMAAKPPSIPLDGVWKWRRGAAHRGDRPTPPADELTPPGTKPTSYAALFNGMMAPFTPYAIRGAIWYQGESNANQPDRYRTFLPMLIADWGRAFERDPLPFGIVQLAAFKAFQPDAPVAGDWAFIREAQSDAAIASPTVGLVVTTDIGDAGDIHPRNKREVGRRLAAWFRGGASSPRISGHALVERPDGSSEFVLEISGTGPLRTRDDEPPTGFAIAGDDGVFRWARARFTDSEAGIAVWHPDIPRPVAVRYAWQSNPENANVTGAEGLPLDGWRSDRPETTDRRD